MCLKDLLAALRGEGLAVSESQIRWAITSGKVSRPQLDGSLRFNFSSSTCKMRRHFTAKAGEAQKC